MIDIVREIRIDAAPEVVREHLTDPERRGGWLDDAPIAPEVTPDGVTYARPGAGDDARVDIEVLPDGDGSRVRVTERIAVPDDVHDVPDVPVSPEARAGHRAGDVIEFGGVDVAGPDPAPLRRQVEGDGDVHDQQRLFAAA